MKKKSRPDPQAKRNQMIRRGAVAAALLAVFAGGAFTVSQLMHSGAEAPKKVIDTVRLQLIQPPPPPPPPPQPQPPPPPQPKQFLEQPKLADKPVEKPPEAPKAAALSTDLKGPGSDNFGLSGSGNGDTIGGGGGDQDAGKFGWYASIIQTQVQALLQKDDKLRSGRYRVILSIWLAPDGKAQRIKLVNATGDTSLDGEIQEQLASMPPLSSAPPQDMPQPVNLRIEGRPSG